MEGNVGEKGTDGKTGGGRGISGFSRWWEAGLIKREKLCNIGYRICSYNKKVQRGRSQQEAGKNMHFLIKNGLTTCL